MIMVSKQGYVQPTLAAALDMGHVLNVMERHFKATERNVGKRWAVTGDLCGGCVQFSGCP
jgi:hypothetical protein